MVLNSESSTSSGTYKSIDSFSSISAFDPVEIKNIVESLVLSKFGPRYDQVRLRSSTRRTKKSPASSTSDYCEILEDNVTQHQSLVKRGAFASRTETSSLGTCDISLMISCQTKRFQSPAKDSTIYFTIAGVNDRTTDDSLSQHLLLEKLDDEMLALTITKEQILKAIHHDDLRRNPTMNAGRLEAERLLLINDTKISLLSQEEPSDIIYTQTGMEFFGSGNLKMSKMRLWCDQIQDYEELFICMLTCGTDVQATDVCKFKSNGILYFKNKFKVTSLKPDDELKIQIYSISATNRRHLAPCLVCDHCLSGDQLLGPLRPGESLFRLWGQHDLKAASFTNIDNIQILFPFGILAASVATHVSLNIHLTGLADVSHGFWSHPMWNKEWVVLKEKRLQFFRFRPDSGAPPDREVELTPMSTVRRPLRRECAKRWTLYVRVSEETLILMALGSQQEFDSWWKFLKCVITQIQTWEKLG